MLRIVGSTISLVGSERRSIAPATNGSQRVGGCNPLLTCSPTVTCSPKTEPKVTVICNSKIEPKVAKKFKRKSSIPIQNCLSKNDNIQIHQYIEMSQDYIQVHAHLWSFSCIGHAKTTLSMYRQPRSWNNIPSFLQWTAPIARSFCEGCTCHLAPASHPGQSTTFLWLERPSSKCAKLPTVAPSNNKYPTSCSSCFCLFAPQVSCSSYTFHSWWIAHSPQC